MTGNFTFTGNYIPVNGISIYYETYGRGYPLVLIHGGGSTIQSSFGRLIPMLSDHFSIIAVELQNHGRSGFRNVPETFEQDADDIAALLNNMGITKAHFFGFSNGGTTAIQISIRHPMLVNKMILVAAAFKRDGFVPGFFDGMSQAKLDNMPKELQDAFLKVTPDPAKLQIMFEKDRDRMIAFTDIKAEQIRSINASALVINGDADVVTAEHAVEIFRMIPGCQLAIIPGGHGKCIGEITTLSGDETGVSVLVGIVKAFLQSRSQGV